MWLMIIFITVTKDQGFTLCLEDTFFEKPQRGGSGGQIDSPNRFRVKQTWWKKNFALWVWLESWWQPKVYNRCYYLIQNVIMSVNLRFSVFTHIIQIFLPFKVFSIHPTETSNSQENFPATTKMRLAVKTLTFFWQLIVSHLAHPFLSTWCLDFLILLL